MAKQGSIVVNLGLNTKQFRSGLDNASRALNRASGQFRKIGSTMTKNFTVPLAIMGAASVKTFVAFDKSMTKIQTLVGVSKDKVDEMKDSVLKLSTETGRGPEELAEGLFVITSAGLRGAEAMEVLEMAAKGSAVGMGDTNEIARALTGVIASYGSENISAAQAMDVFTATIREGNLDATALAPVLGRITGIASQMGISFADVGANIAAYTRLGVSAEEATTGLRGVLNGILKPSDKAADAFANLADQGFDIKKKIKDQGLARTLVELIDAFDGNVEAVAELFPNVRGLANILGVAGEQGEDYIDIADNIMDSNGLLDEAFEGTTGTLGHQLNVLKASLATVGVEIGSILAPAIEKITGIILILVEKFKALTDEQKKQIVKWAAIIAAIGPALLLLASLLKIIPMIRLAMMALTGPVGIVVGALALAAVLIVKHWSKIKEYFTTGEGATMFESLKGTIETTMMKIANIMKVVGAFIAKVWEIVGPFIVERMKTWFGRMVEFLQLALNLVIDIIDIWGAIFAGDWEGIWKGVTVFFSRIWNFIVDVFFGALIKIAGGLKKIAEKLGVDAFSNTEDQLRGLSGALKSNVPIMKDAARSTEKLNKKLKKQREEAEKDADALKELDNAGKDLFGDDDGDGDGDGDGGGGGGGGFDLGGGDIDDKTKSLQEYFATLSQIEQKKKAFGLTEAEATDEKLRTMKQTIEGLIGQGLVVEDVIDPNTGEVLQKADQDLIDMVNSYNKLKNTAGDSSWVEDLDAKWQKMTKGIQEGMSKAIAVAQTVGNAVSGVIDALTEKENDRMDQRLNNMQTEFDTLWNNRELDIENSTMSEEAKEAALEQLAVDRADAQEDLDKDMDKKKQKLANKQAKREWKMKMFSAVVNGASAVLSAMSAPFGWLLAPLVAGMAAIQVGIIRSNKPPELAMGGLATAPTLAMVGDNPNANIDPEVIAPLSKLTGMLGQQGPVEVVGKISGSDLLIVTDRAQKDRTRIRGF